MSKEKKVKQDGQIVLLYTGDTQPNPRIENGILNEFKIQGLPENVTIQTVTNPKIITDPKIIDGDGITLASFKNLDTRPVAVLVKIAGNGNGLSLIFAARDQIIPVIAWMWSGYHHLKNSRLKERFQKSGVVCVYVHSQTETKSEIEKIALSATTAIQSHADAVALEASNHAPK